LIKGLAIGVAIAVTTTAFTAETSARTRCFDAEHTRERRLMRGNLDGDGTRDAAWVGARRREGRCRYYFFVQSSRSGRSRVRLRAPDKFSRYSMRHSARPIAMVRIDDTAGREIAVKLLQGASVSPFGFFTLRQGRARRMQIEGGIAKPLAARDMFAYGGGLALMFATDCAYRKSPRTVLHSRAYPRNEARNRYVVERRWYQVQGHDFVRTGHPVQKEVLRIGRIRKRFREFRHGGLLAHCEGKVLDPRRA
jgi:hypothetical protein